MPTVNKRTIAHILHTLSAVKTWQLVIILIIGIVLSASLLRLNNLGMIERREAVRVADESGDTEALRESIVSLQSYVSSHMNTSLGPNGFYLENKFNRDRAAALEAATDEENPNASVYQRASVECQNRFQGGTDSFRNDYVQCVVDQVARLSSDDGPGQVQLPKPELYRVNFASPVWSLDLAGLSVLFCLFITVVIITKLLVQIILRAVLKRRYRTI